MSVNLKNAYMFLACQLPDEPEYPFHDRTVRVTKCGRICLAKRKINLSRAIANQVVGIREVSEKIWLVSFMEYDLGFFDQDQDRVEPADNPFTPKVSSRCPGRRVEMARSAGVEPTTFGFGGQHSIQLSYERIIFPVQPGGAGP